MNRLELAQRIADEFTTHGKKVAKTREGSHMSWILIYQDGSEDTVTGKLAADLKKAPSPS